MKRTLVAGGKVKGKRTALQLRKRAQSANNSAQPNRAIKETDSDDFTRNGDPKRLR